MRNLAERISCDFYIKDELTEAGIEIHECRKTTNEVPYSIYGKLGNATFTRAWYYWKVICCVPLNIAEELYGDPIGHRDIRVAGHCGRPSPRRWTYDNNVYSYHIDSQEGLNLFAATIKKYNL